MENIHHFSQAYFLFLHIWSKFLKKCCVYAEKSSDKATFAVPEIFWRNYISHRTAQNVYNRCSLRIAAAACILLFYDSQRNPVIYAVVGIHAHKIVYERVAQQVFPYRICRLNEAFVKLHFVLYERA